MAFDEHVDAVVGLENFGQLFEGLFTFSLHFPAGRGEQQFLIHRDIHLAVTLFHLEAAALEVLEGVAHLFFQGAHFGIFLVKNLLQLGEAAGELVQRILLGLELFRLTFEAALQIFQFLLFIAKLHLGTVEVAGQLCNGGTTAFCQFLDIFCQFIIVVARFGIFGFGLRQFAAQVEGILFQLIHLRLK